MTETGRSDAEPIAPDEETAGVAPAEVFSMLSNETRIEILRTLWEHRESPVSFSELYGELDVDKGNFNYHLSKLTGHFVRSTGGGYELKEAGKQVIRAVLAGTMTADPTIEPTDLGVPCPLCGSSIEFSYGDEWLTVRCTDCEGVLGGDVPPGTFMHHTFPPAGLEGREDVEVLEAARVRYETEAISMVQGVCPECSGRVGRDIHVCADHDTDADGMCAACGSVPGVWVEHVCENCELERWFTLWLPVLFHPAVISFIHEHQPFDTLLDLRRLLWLRPESIAAISQTVVSEEPLHVRVTIPFADERICVVVDDALNTVTVERSDRDS